jgi:hypothetical protein
MAIYKIFPEKDATIYSEYPLKNTGLDEILDISTTYTALTPQANRALIKFSQDEITSILDNRIGTSSFQTNLKLFIANITGLNSDTTLNIYPISGSWNMGTGRYSYNPQVTDGVGWTYRLSSGSSAWSTAGGDWYTTPSQSQVLSYSSDKDINVNVTDTVLEWYSSSIDNDGFIIKQASEFVADLNYTPGIKYFSIDTHTIYPPQLEFRWRDYVFNTGSSIQTIINTPRLVASLDNNKGTYRLNSIEKFRVNCRPQYPTRTFQTSSWYVTNYYLPTASFYAIKDLDTNEYVIDFDDQYTQLSADEQNSYFTLYMNGLEPERYYKVLLKTTINGETIILDDNYYFKIING